MPKSKEKSYRSALYFECICGVVSSIISIFSIIFMALIEGIYSSKLFTIAIIFWSSYLLFSIFLISIGIITYFQEKKYGVKKSRKELKPPIV